MGPENQLADFKMPNDLHAKAFLFKHGTYLICISDPLTQRTMHHGNIEFMVCLQEKEIRHNILKIHF